HFQLGVVEQRNAEAALQNASRCFALRPGARALAREQVAELVVQTCRIIAGVDDLLRRGRGDDVLHLDIEVIDRKRKAGNEARLEQRAQRQRVRGFLTQVLVAAAPELQRSGVKIVEAFRYTIGAAIGQPVRRS